jgi:uncharacterized membrane protein
VGISGNDNTDAAEVQGLAHEISDFLYEQRVIVIEAHKMAVCDRIPDYLFISVGWHRKLVLVKFAWSLLIDAPA